MKTKLIALILALLCFVGVFAACDSGNNTNETEGTKESQETQGTGEGSEITPGSGSEETTAEETRPSTHPTIEKTNYNDTLFLHVFERPSLLWVEESEDAAFFG